MNVTHFSLAAAMAMAATAPATHAETRFTAGYDYSSGDYGQAVTTEIETAYAQWQSLGDTWSFSLKVPWIRVTGDGTVVPGLTGPVSFGETGGLPGFGGGAGTGTTTRSGLGDVTASVGYVLPARHGFYEVSAWVKLGTADPDQGLGTGENDYSLQFDAVPGSGGITPFLTAGYTVTGDSSGITYEDTAYASVGLMVRGRDGATAGIGYDWREAAVAGGPELRQVSGFVEWRANGAWSLALSGLVGLSDGAPDYGFGLALVHRN